uniref:TATA box-binding protein-associated factor RNA polymerase I subunit B n=2 Tax=Auxenochlorella protothecoides TaxID=3075 RepID=A0A1D2AGC9_AUXPR
MQEEGALCQVCWQGHMELQEGMLVCDVCGSVDQGFTQLTEEFEGGPSQRTTQRGLKKTRESGAVQERTALPVKESLRAYVEILQHLLQRQAKVLVEELGCDPGVMPLLRSLWYRCLNHSRLLHPEFCQDLTQRVHELDAKERAGGIHGRNLHGPAWLFMTTLSRVLAPHVTLELCFLAAWTARAAVSPHDITRSAASGRLPFLTLAADSEEFMAPYRALISRLYLARAGAPNAATLMHGALRLAAALRLPLPPLNAGLWLCRWRHELGLPHGVAEASEQLARLHCPPGSRAMHLRPHAPQHPWAMLMACVLCTLRFVYGLDGHGRRGETWRGDKRGAAPPEGGWVRWAAAALTRRCGATVGPTNVAEGLAMPREDLAEWLAFLRSKHFVGHSCPEDLAEACALLERAGRAFLGAALDVDATSGAAAARRPDGGDDDEAGAGRRLQAPAPGWPATPAPQPPAPISTNTSPRPAPGGPGATPPDPTPLADGTYTWIGKLGPHGWVALPSDYAAVLAACAAHVWCTPLTMHRMVLEVDWAMVRTEVKVAYEADAMEPLKLERIREEGRLLQEMRKEFRDALARMGLTEETVRMHAA